MGARVNEGESTAGETEKAFAAPLPTVDASGECRDATEATVTHDKHGLQFCVWEIGRIFDTNPTKV